MEEAVGRETIRSRVERSSHITAPKTPWWRNLLVALGITAGTVVSVAISETFNQPTSEQKRAEVALNDPTTVKRTLKVVNDPEVIEAGGLAVRNKPGADTPGDPPTTKRLPPDYIIQDAISWVPVKDGLYTNKGSWVAFKNEKGEIMFASGKFLAEIQTPSKP